MPNTLLRYLVISYDDDQQQWFYDHVLAESAEAAREFVETHRPYCIAADTITPKEGTLMMQTLYNSTDQKILDQMEALRDELSIYQSNNGEGADEEPDVDDWGPIHEAEEEGEPDERL